MKKYFCKYCNRKMDVSFLEYKSNSFCNLCFDERSVSKSIIKREFDFLDFMGEKISMVNNNLQKTHPTFRNILNISKSNS